MDCIPPVHTQLAVTNEARAALKAKFDATAPILEALLLLDLCGRAEVADAKRMKYKHATDKEMTGSPSGSVICSNGDPFAHDEQMGF